jgi:type II secretory ATPase GspE/PulE/Tfp pilus assembly ATPase PilB-like protein
MEVEPFLLGSTLNLIIAQRLARKICPHCKKETKMPENVLAEIEKEIEYIPKNVIKEALSGLPDTRKTIFYKGEGCPRCGYSGYSGRVAIVEALDINSEIKNIIIDKNKILRMEDVRSSQDFINMKQDGIIKVLRGQTTMEEILRVIES